MDVKSERKIWDVVESGFEFGVESKEWYDCDLGVGVGFYLKFYYEFEYIVGLDGVGGLFVFGVGGE